MQKTKFKFKDNDYKIIIQSRETLGAIRLLEDCCAESCMITGATGAPFIVKSTLDYVLRSMCWAVAGVAMTEAQTNELMGTTPVEFLLPDGKKYDPMKPTVVPGTSKDVKYDTLLTTYNGLISYQHGKIMDAPVSNGNKAPRIRIVKADPAASWPDICINDTGVDFSTTENTHLSHTGSTVEETRKLIARGAFILLNIKKDFQ